jgi:hypothetical protein
METLIIFAFIGWIAYVFYRTGKGYGSISGFNVDRRGRRYRR